MSGSSYTCEGNTLCFNEWDYIEYLEYKVGDYTCTFNKCKFEEGITITLEIDRNIEVSSCKFKCNSTIRSSLLDMIIEKNYIQINKSQKETVLDVNWLKVSGLYGSVKCDYNGLYNATVCIFCTNPDDEGIVSISSDLYGIPAYCHMTITVCKNVNIDLYDESCIADWDNEYFCDKNLVINQPIHIRKRYSIMLKNMYTFL